MLHTSYIELSKQALKTNIDFVRSHLSKKTRYSMVIKANAYGHGIEELLPVIESCGVQHFSVFSATEALRVCEVKKLDSEVMILGWIDDDQMEWAIEKGVSFYVFTQNRLEAAVRTAQKTRRKARIHLELETGMYRTGLSMAELPTTVELLKKHAEDISVEGFCTHYAGAESISNYERIKDQIQTFRDLCSWLQHQGITARYKHTACSAALLNYPETQMDLVRIGIAGYGFWPSEETRMNKLLKHPALRDPLKRVISWKSVIMSINTVPEGKYISYGRSYLTNRNTRIATIPVGYGYGFSRNLSNIGYVLVNGKRVPIIGAVNMNMMVIDVTDLESVGIGDEVVLIGEQNGQAISVSSFSEMNNMLNYEQLVRLPEHIPRYIVD